MEPFAGGGAAPSPLHPPPAFFSNNSHQHATAFHPCLTDTSCKGCYLLYVPSSPSVVLSSSLLPHPLVPLLSYISSSLLRVHAGYALLFFTLSTILFVLTSFHISLLPFSSFSLLSSCLSSFFFFLFLNGLKVWL